MLGSKGLLLDLKRSLEHRLGALPYAPAQIYAGQVAQADGSSRMIRPEFPFINIENQLEQGLSRFQIAPRDVQLGHRVQRMRQFLLAPLWLVAEEPQSFPQRPLRFRVS